MHNSSDVLTVGQHLRLTSHLKTLIQGWKRQALRITIDSQDKVPCHLLAPEMFDGNRSEGLVLRLSEVSRRMLWRSRKFTLFSLQKGKFPFPLSHSPPANIGSSIQELSCRGGELNGFSLFPSLSFHQPA
jgi:hypothetical protein